MELEVDPYDGREHSKIKHLFLAEYLAAASFKVLQGNGATSCFTYVDGFAGPWSVADSQNYSDSSFDNAVRVLLRTKEALSKAGRRMPRLRFLLCEKEPTAFSRLRDYAEKAKQASGIEIEVFEGCFEDNLNKIAPRCQGFTFSFIDPKGWNLRSDDIGTFLAKTRGDFLLNFMEHPISRHNSYAGVESSFARFLGDPDWSSKIATSPQAPPREVQILGLLKARIRSLRAAKFLPDFPILKPKANRVQMRLILGTHHIQGVEVFRTVQRHLEQTQNETRRRLQDNGNGKPSLFPEEMLTQMELDGRGVSGYRSWALAYDLARNLIAGGKTFRFDELAVRVMEQVPVRITDMKDVVNKMKVDGLVDFNLPPRALKPNEQTFIHSCAGPTV